MYEFLSRILAPWPWHYAGKKKQAKINFFPRSASRFRFWDIFFSSCVFSSSHPPSKACNTACWLVRPLFLLGFNLVIKENRELARAAACNEVIYLHFRKVIRAWKIASLFWENGFKTWKVRLFVTSISWKEYGRWDTNYILMKLHLEKYLKVFVHKY